MRVSISNEVRARGVSSEREMWELAFMPWRTPSVGSATMPTHAGAHPLQQWVNVPDHQARAPTFSNWLLYSSA